MYSFTYLDDNFNILYKLDEFTKNLDKMKKSSDKSCLGKLFDQIRSAKTSGKLQSIHHIESYKVIDDYQEDFGLPFPTPAGKKHYLYELGTAIRPAKKVSTIDKANGFTQIQRSARCECFFDLLLTCDSVSEAFYKTQLRLNSDK